MASRQTVIDPGNAPQPLEVVASGSGAVVASRSRAGGVDDPQPQEVVASSSRDSTVVSQTLDSRRQREEKGKAPLASTKSSIRRERSMSELSSNSDYSDPPEGVQEVMEEQPRGFKDVNLKTYGVKKILYEVHSFARMNEKREVSTCGSWGPACNFYKLEQNIDSQGRKRIQEYKTATPERRQEIDQDEGLRPFSRMKGKEKDHLTQSFVGYPLGIRHPDKLLDESTVVIIPKGYHKEKTKFINEQGEQKLDLNYLNQTYASI